MEFSVKTWRQRLECSVAAPSPAERGTGMSAFADTKRSEMAMVLSVSTTLRRIADSKALTRALFQPFLLVGRRNPEARLSIAPPLCHAAQMRPQLHILLFPRRPASKIYPGHQPPIDPSNWDGCMLKQPSPLRSTTLLVDRRVEWLFVHNLAYHRSCQKGVGADESWGMLCDQFCTLGQPSTRTTTTVPSSWHCWPILCGAAAKENEFRATNERSIKSVLIRVRSRPEPGFWPQPAALLASQFSVT